MYTYIYTHLTEIIENVENYPSAVLHPKGNHCEHSKSLLLSKCFIYTHLNIHIRMCKNKYTFS